MPGVFLSYSRADRALARRVLLALRRLGVDVWWDEDMPGVDWQDELARQINDLAAVVVLWTPASIASKNVKDEARLGQHTEKLVNALSGVSSPPFPFDRTNGLPLDGWNGHDPHGGWTRLVATLEDHLVKAGRAKTGDLTHALQRQEAEIAALRAALADAETAFQAAKNGEAAAAQALADAGAALDLAHERLGKVMDLGGANLIRAAQADLNAAISAREAADQACKAAATELATASRALGKARADLERVFEEPGGAGVPAAAPLPVESEPAPTPAPAPAPKLAKGRVAWRPDRAFAWPKAWAPPMPALARPPAQTAPSQGQGPRRRIGWRTRLLIVYVAMLLIAGVIGGVAQLAHLLRGG